MHCKFCGVSFEPIKKTQKYCSARCREKDWVKNNPERDRELKKKSRLKKPVLCKNCKRKIPDSLRGRGVGLCSEKCRKEKRNYDRRMYSRRLHKEFLEFKEKNGCSRCGYKKYGGSIDFHHVDPTQKKCRIRALNWQNCKEEMSKCVLLCKNCHYEVHHKERKKEVK